MVWPVFVSPCQYVLVRASKCKSVSVRISICQFVLTSDIHTFQLLQSQRYFLSQSLYFRIVDLRKFDFMYYSYMLSLNIPKKISDYKQIILPFQMEVWLLLGILTFDDKSCLNFVP